MSLKFYRMVATKGAVMVEPVIDFLALGQTSREWRGMGSLGSNVYACVGGTGDIYMQTGGTGDFVALGQTSRNWSGLTSDGTNVYACVPSGDIYMQDNS